MGGGTGGQTLSGRLTDDAHALSLPEIPPTAKWIARAGGGGQPSCNQIGPERGPEASLVVHLAVPEFEESAVWGARTIGSESLGSLN